MPLYKVKLRQTCVMRKTMIVEAEDESEAKRVAFKTDNEINYAVDPKERKRRFVTSINKLTSEDL